MPRVDIPGRGIVEFPNNMTNEQIEAVIKHEQVQSSPSMSKLKSAGIGAMTGFENLAHGIIQPALESGYLGQNAKTTSELMAQERNKRYQEASQANPMSAMAGRVGGSVAGSIPAMMIPGAGKSGLMKSLTQGFAQGAVTGGAEYVPEGESRAANSAIGGTEGSIIQGLLKFVGSSNPILRTAIQSGLGATVGYGLGGTPGAELGALAGPFSARYLPRNSNTERLKLLENVDMKKAQPRLDAAERLELSHLSPAEAMASPYMAAIEGKVGKTREGSKISEEKSSQRIESEKKSISDMLSKIFSGSPEEKKKISDLYLSSYQESLSPNTVNSLLKSDVISEAFDKVKNVSAFRDDLKGIKPNNFSYLDKVKQALDDMQGVALRNNEGRQAALIGKKKDKLIEKMDEKSPAYKEAREISQRQIIRNQIEEKLNDKKLRGTTFYSKVLANDSQFKDLIHSLKNAPEAQQALKDMRLIFDDLINPSTLRGASQLSKTNMTSGRSFKESMVDFFNDLTGSKFDKEKVELITSPAWREELKNISKMKDKQQKAENLRTLFGKISTAAAVTSSSENNKPKKMLELEMNRYAGVEPR